MVSHLAEGMTSNEIARELKISNHTVDWYINGLQNKMKARNRQHVVAIAFRRGLSRSCKQHVQRRRN
ncbi:DNA-binding CsgD family transcriptional regulator [Pseudorhizobium tarimense]|uniref:DNA-binding CsgD family transcriptional regulator n=1 Tax=Pseudorhizobium tarimense TaxID=1079109 RepID=A0ABV2H838_9HYPH|nr:helix-turn-helix transcriptional regulator [Pseudorhizobium tarimense]